MRIPFIYKLFKKEKKESAVQPLIMAQYGSSGPVWSDKDYENFAKEVYLKNIIGFRCIFFISSSISSVPWILYRKKSKKENEEIEDHPINNLLNRANPENSFNSVLLKACAFLLLSGNCYFEKVGPLSGPNREIPRELYALRPDRMKVVKNEQMITGYEYRVGGRTKFFEKDPISMRGNILHIKMFHPTNDFYGASPVESASYEIDTSNKATQWNKKILDNEGRPGMVVTIVGDISDQQFEKYKKFIKKFYEGSENAGRTLILSGEKGTDAKPYAWSPKELEMIEGNREMARKICIAWGVPPMLLGIPGDNTYSNYQEARTAFWDETNIFYLNLFKTELNNWLFHEFNGMQDLFINYNLDDVPAYAERRMKDWEKADRSNDLTINEKRGLKGYSPIDGGDVVLIPASMIPLGMEEDFKKEEDEEEKEKRKLEKFMSKQEIDDLLIEA